MDFQGLTLFFLTLCAVTLGQINLAVRFVIFEEVLIDTLVGNIANESGIQARVNMSSEEFETLRYDFLDQSAMQNLFSVQERNGNLRTADVIDRESVCGFKESCILDFDILVHSSLNMIIVSVSIEVLDKNDHSPIFPSKIVSLSILESSNNGSTLILDEATDLDSSNRNNIQNYEIIPSNGTFGLNASKKQDGGFNLKLVLQQPLDRETKDLYVFHVIAKDGGNPPNMGTVEININVLDNNDNPPIFDRTSYSTDVKEGASVGSTVLQIMATDNDIGRNGQVEYRFSSRQSDQDVMKLFEINHTSGIITVKGNLIYEPGKKYKIFVEASDKGEQPQVTQTTVEVTVLDAGNNKPIIRINFLVDINVVDNVSVANVPESSNKVIGHVNVEDTDSGQNGLIQCNLSDDSFSITELNPGKGFLISIKTQLDRELKELHEVNVICFDHGTPQLTSSVYFKVSVTDANDNAPKFKQHTYFAMIEENNVIGAIVTQVSAEDDDIGRNAEIMYFLNDDAGGKFAINSNTGVITANTNFDREEALRHLFTVLAVDSGNPTMTGTTTVILTVEDKNDNAPNFDVPSFQFFVMENSPIKSSSIGPLNAKDLDDGDNKKISFSVSPEYESSVPFIVFPNGSIQTTRILDRETRSKYEFTIVATDHGIPRLSSTADIVIYVIDENDNYPVFNFPNSKNKTVIVPYKAVVGSLIARVSVFDSDEEGPNSYLTYSIAAGNDHDIFSISGSSGNIYLKRSYALVSDQEFILTISATDMGQIPKSTSRELKIILQFSNATAVAQLPTENGTRNVIISIVVVALTIISSAIMITVICLLKRKDKNQMIKGDPNQFIAVKTITNGNHLYGKPDSELVQYSTPQKKKKEVSFSLEEDDFNNSINSVFMDSNEVPCEQKQNGGQLKTLHLHQVHLKSHLDHDMQKQSDQHTQFDDISDSSEETNNSDSGKGGSDVDIPNVTLQDGTFSYFNGKPKSSGSSSFHPLSLVTKLSQAAKTKNKHDRSRKNHPKSTSDMYSTDLESNTRGHNSLPLSTSRHYENLHGDRSQNEVPRTSETWVPSYV